MTVYHIDGTQMLTVAGPAKVNIGGDGPVIAAVPQPTVGALEPSTAVCGDPDLELVVTGQGFTELSKITFNGLDEPTALLSPTQVRTNVKPSLFAVAAVCPVGVRTGGLASNTLDFTFTDAGGARKRR